MTPANKKPEVAGKSKRKARWYRFKIDAFTPDTMPMARLAEYLSELAEILGEPHSVHLVKVEEGSTTVVHKIEHEAVPKVTERVKAVGRGDAPRDALRAYDNVNNYLREDNARAVLRKRKTGPKVLEFPGRDEAEEQFHSVNQYGSISGVVARVGGVGDQARVLLESNGDQIAGLHASREVAKSLARYLFEPIRLVGQGYWMRDKEGEWQLRHFRIDGFEEVDEATLSEALTELRAVAGEWDEGIYEELEALRHGEHVDGSD